jgi:colicin import membrane protein
MRNINIKIWSLAAALCIAFTCSYSQQGQGSAEKLREKKEAKQINKKEALKNETQKDAERKDAKLRHEPKKTADKEITKPKDHPKPKKDIQTNKPTKAISKNDSISLVLKHKIDSIKNMAYAYGKDKEGIEGAEFGKERAEQARLNKEAKKEMLSYSITLGELRVVEARNKLSEAKEQLEKDKTNRKITESQYQATEENIVKAEAAVNELENKVKDAKTMMAK